MHCCSASTSSRNLPVSTPPTRIPAGLSESFQRNGLANLDRELGSRFSEGRFEHYAVWDEEQEWVEIGFRSNGAQVFDVPGLDIEVAFSDGETLRTSVSSKFRRERFEAELAAAHLRPTRWWTDANGDFALVLAVKVPL